MTTNEIATRAEHAIELLPPAQTPAANAVAMLREHAELMSMAYGLADKMCNTKLVPTRFFKKPEDGTAAILYGLELGLNPIQSLQRVIPIHGMPTLESLTMVALLEAKGYTIKTVEETDDVCEVHGWKPGRDPKVDEPDATSRWTIERAIKARYVPQPSSPTSAQRPEVDADWVTVTKTWDGKAKTSVVGNMKYVTDPQAMLVAKCQARVCKAIGSSVLLGIAGSTEEMRSEQRYEDEEPSSTRVRSTRDDAVTVDEVVGDPELAKSSRLGDKIKPAPPAPPADPDPEPADPAAAAPEAPPVTEEVPRSEVSDTEEVATQVENTTADPGPGEPPSDRPPVDDTAARNKLLDRLTGLFINAGVPKSEDENRRTVAAHILEHPVASIDKLTTADLAVLNTELAAWKRKGDLGTQVNEVINAAFIQAENANTEGTESE